MFYKLITIAVHIVNTISMNNKYIFNMPLKVVNQLATSRTTLFLRKTAFDLTDFPIAILGEPVYVCR